MRKEFNLTQVERSEKPGVGLRLVRELKQGVVIIIAILLMGCSSDANTSQTASVNQGNLLILLILSFCILEKQKIPVS